MFARSFQIGESTILPRSNITVKCYLCLWTRYGMRYEGDIIPRNKWKSICRAVLINDNAPDSGLSDMRSSPLGSTNFCSLHLLNTFICHTHMEIPLNLLLSLELLLWRPLFKIMNGKCLVLWICGKPVNFGKPRKCQHVKQNLGLIGSTCLIETFPTTYENKTKDAY